MRRLFSCLILVTCVLVIHCRVLERQARKAEVSDEFSLDKKVPGLLDAQDREKRGIGAIIAVSILTTAQIASSSYQLWTAVSEGCNIEPSICTDREEIRRLEDVLTTKSEEYDNIYYANQWKFLNLQEAMINNKYIMRYVNDTVAAVETIGDIIAIITTRLQVSLQNMEMMYANSNGTINGTVSTLADLVGPFEYQLDNIEEQIKAMKKSAIIGLIAQRVGEIVVGKMVNYVNNVVEKARGASIDNDIIHRMSSSNVDLPAEDFTFWQKTKNWFSSGAENVGFTFKAVGADMKTRFGTTLPENFRSWRAATSSWDSFKGKLRSTFLGDQSTITKIQNFFEDPAGSIKYKIKNFKFSKGAAFMEVVGLVIDAIQIAIEARQWADVAKSLREAKADYETYVAQVNEALDEVRNETVTLNNYWSETIASFSGLVNQFTEVITKVQENNIFLDVFGLSNVPVDASHAFFSTDFNATTETDVKSKQDIVIDFFNLNGQSLTLLKDKFKVQEILVSEVKDLTEQDDSIQSMYEIIQRIYDSFDSETIRNYSSQLVKQDVVCSAAMILPNENVYDFYPLTTFRTNQCNISSEEYLQLDQNAAEQRDKRILLQSVEQNVPKKQTPSTILDLAKGAYSLSGDQRLIAVGAALTEKDVVCEISVQNPVMDNYMFYDLTPFRPDCSQVDDAEFTQIKAEAQKLENAKGTIGFAMLMCDSNPLYCQCPSALSGMLGVTVQETNLLIEDYKQENKPSCNYVEENGVCRWDCP